MAFLVAKNMAANRFYETFTSAGRGWSECSFADSQRESFVDSANFMRKWSCHMVVPIWKCPNITGCVHTRYYVYSYVHVGLYHMEKSYDIYIYSTYGKVLPQIVRYQVLLGSQICDIY
eukprot:SAG11_NODE_1685_length_4449_cov_4.411954_5_plen_118_part_00